jgi:uncharacterized protein (DUF1778 family)
MATATFDRDIVIDQEAAERLVAALNEPAAPRPDLGEDWWYKNKKEVEEWSSRFKK